MYKLRSIKTSLDNIMFICILIILSANNSIAAIPHGAESTNGKNCWVEAGKRYQIDPWLLYSIAQQESSLNPVAVNDNGTSIDVGLMQINSFWFSKLKKIGISKNDLFEPCISIHVGAWILAQSILIYGETWEAVGAYNAGTGKNENAVKNRKLYAEKVYNYYLHNVNRVRDQQSLAK